MINYRHRINRLDPAKLFGFAIEIHPKYKTAMFFVGHHTFDFWTGYRK
jgi:hypothetical protein